jgi:hypothetical protein
MALAWNFLEMEGSIIEQLTIASQQGPDRWARHIATRGELSSIVEEGQVVPAIYVVYDGFRPVESTPQQAKLLQRWLVVVAVSNAAKNREASARNQEAGPYLASVFQALHGYLPTGAAEALMPAQPPRPHFSDGGFAYYPTAWVCETVHFTRTGPARARRPGETASFPNP